MSKPIVYSNKFKTGETYPIRIRTGLKLTIGKIHILGIFDNKAVAYKYWTTPHYGWKYCIEDINGLIIEIEKAIALKKHIKLTKKSNNQARLFVE